MAIENNAAFERAVKLAVVTGLRAALGPALLAAAHNRPERNQLAMAALGEMVFDKLPYVPSRSIPYRSLIAARAGRGLGRARSASRRRRRTRRALGRPARRGGGRRQSRRGGPQGPGGARVDAILGIPQPVLGLDGRLSRLEARHRGPGPLDGRGLKPIGGAIESLEIKGHVLPSGSTTWRCKLLPAG